ncbi:ROK family protein [Gordonia sp. (in: high G+C Gram-positive bacteria)]|jgi:glucokinase|uniref:ROK family protein n=1 Tax=Gordonia sp. (in: high G+C Gram-positive bacteria) TaxID=84139 RepID=UPI001D4F2292|nr:ROK family protein [Gordonia sp. (in: high G+C Gram-positive bacteria)]MCB1293942.1 ROK family protein [Gordonia sp. (in: high G+C Gram-positive bacteria)]HMS75673.1 ROK family protein [Gordonia sp. (in: high G+C Gram-positive bacteria)]
MATLTIGIDIGGTSVRASVVDDKGAMLDTLRAATPPTADALEHCLDRLVGELVSRWAVKAVGLAIAGFLTRDRQIVRFAPHLPWREASVAAEMSARIGLPVFAEHDANAAAVAEYRYGAAARGHNSLVLAIGTGIGSGLILDGEIYRGSFGVAPELGHLTIVPGGRRCSCGKAGCWERYCSGTALVDTVIELLANGDWGRSALAADVAADPGSLTGRRVARAAADGDAVALAAYSQLALSLGQGLAMIADIFDPDLIVLAGGVGASSGLFLDEAREHYARLVTGAGYRQLARIRGTQLGEAAGVIGAAEVARQGIGATDPRFVTVSAPAPVRALGETGSR